MKTLFLLFTIATISHVTFAQGITKTIKGQVTDGTQPLGNVNIKIIDLNKGTKTNNSGRYSLKASVGDLIEYSHLGYAPVQIIIEDVTEVLNLKMTPEMQKLDGVVVKKYKKKTNTQRLLEYESNKDLIQTAYGLLDKRKSAMSLNIIDESDFFPGALTFADAIQGKFNGRITYLRGAKVVYLRERPNLLSGPQPAIFDVDGVITDADMALLIPVSEIKRIAILRSLSTSSRYGSRANGGVIVINTKTGRIKPKINAIKVKDLQAARAQFLDDNFCEPNQQIQQSAMLKNLLLSESEAMAIELFNDKKVFFKNFPYVLIDAGNYFNTRWKNYEKANEIWNDVKINFSNNTNVLKVVAYYFEQNNSFREALAIYQKISALRPNYAQSYRDLANMQNQLQNPMQALNIYGLYLKSQKSHLPTASLDGVDFVVNVEVADVLSKNKIEISRELKNIKLPVMNAPIRIILEWNNGETEFDIAMIRKDTPSFIWKHSYQETPDQIMEEKKQGYAIKQFFMDKDDAGNWVCNMRYLGNKSPYPSYVKVTLQYNFGTLAQKNTIKVIRLAEQEECLQLFTI